jgi:heme/copper-type cytochrome/quinol oxidase subunit 2
VTRVQIGFVVLGYAAMPLFFVLGLLYGMGRINLFASSAPHAHHITHLLICWLIAFVSPIIATVLLINFDNAARRKTRV